MEIEFVAAGAALGEKTALALVVFEGDLLSGAAGPALAAAAAGDDLRHRVDAARVPVSVLVDAASPQRYLDAVHAALGGSRVSIEALDGGGLAQHAGARALATRLLRSA